MYVNGLQNIQKNKAYIVTSNHPAGFMEPLIMACLFPRDLYFMTRGDLFANKLYNYVFTATHQIPIFRFKDGFSNLRNNQESIKRAVDALKDKKALLIFAEGNTKYCFESRPLQKGFLRIGFQAVAEDPNLEIEILPVGLSYNHVDRFGSDVILNVGTPFGLNQFFDRNDELNAKGTRAAIQQTEAAMKTLVFNAKTEEEYNQVRNQWKELTQNDGFLPRVVKDNPLFTNILSSYKTASEELNVFRVNGKYHTWSLLLLPLSIPSYIVSALPRALMFQYRDNKVKNIEFKFPVMFAVGVLSFTASILLFSFIITIILGVKALLLFLVLLLISGLTHLIIMENLGRRRAK
jgi:1-acyl-sn-glycerol-3-phosphate acyltransferase